MLRTLITFIFALILIGVAGVDARACQCAGEGVPCQQYWEASAVFIGTVIEGRPVKVKSGDFEHEQRAIRISIDEAFRGVEGAEVEVITGLGDSDCGFGFRRSQQYLVYAYRGEDQKLHTSVCTRTRAISDADPDLLYIRGLSRAKRGSTISGEVIRERRNETGGSDAEPLAGIKVSIEGPQKAEAVTNAKGEFKIEGVQAGDYTVVPAAPKGLATRGEDQKVTVADRGCAVAYLWLYSNARIAGRVINPEGFPVKNAALTLVDADKPRFTGHTDYAYGDENGGYSFKLIPPGRYVIHLRYDGMMTSQHRPFPVIYYPGTTDKSQAHIFPIKEGDAVDLDIKVPPLPPESEIRGQVVWPDGKPAPTAKVGYGTDGVSYAVSVDEEGRFSFKVYNGITIGISAYVETAPRQYVRANGPTIIVGVNIEPIKLVLRPSP